MPSWLNSKTAEKLTETHHGGVLLLVSSLPTPRPPSCTLRSHSTMVPSTDAVINTSGEKAPYVLESSGGGPRGLALGPGATPRARPTAPAGLGAPAAPPTSSSGSSNSGSYDASDLASSSFASDSCPACSERGAGGGGERIGPSGRTATTATCAPVDVNFRTRCPVFKSHCWSHSEADKQLSSRTR